MVTPRIWRFVSGQLDLTARTAVMGILNVTPDSFSDGGLYIGIKEAVAHALRMQAEGADILDIGAQSTRPGHAPVGPDEEWARLGPVLRELRSRTHLPLSVDTYDPQVACAALEAGADILNDVSGSLHNGFLALAARTGAGLVAMHAGAGADDAALDAAAAPDAVAAYFQTVLAAADVAGLPRDRLCLDPGIGFGKSRAGDLALLARLDRLGGTESTPLLVGASRKRVTVAALDDGPAVPPTARLGGTFALHTAAQLHGARVLRVHDVAAAVQAARAIDALRAPL